MIEAGAFTIQLAGKRIHIRPLYDMVREYCKAYIVPDACADLSVQILAEDIAYERRQSERETELTGQKEAAYTDAYLETLAVYRRIAEWMPMQNTLLFHGSAIAVDGKAYLFTAKSGVGKSTHTGLWRAYFGNRAVMINDDKPLLRMTEDGIYAYGTPWDGKHRLSTNTCAPLAGICMIRRGSDNMIREITAHEAYPMLLQQCYRPMGKDALIHTLQLLDCLREKVPCYELFCNISREAVETAYNGMKGQESDQ